MQKLVIHHFRYVLILMAIVVCAEYTVMIIFDITELEDTLSQEAEAITDSMLLLLLASLPVYYWIIKPILKLSQSYQTRLENLAGALEDAGDAIIITDLKGNITFANKAFTTITGYSSDEVMGKNPRMMQSGKQSKAFYKMMWRSINDTGQWQGEIINRRKNGTEFTERLHIKAIHDAKGQVMSYIGNITDISDLKHQEMLIRQSQKMEAVGTLVGGVAHNFNNLLAGIIGKAFLGQMKSKEPQTIQYLKDIENISNDAALIVRQLLTFSHAGRQQKKNTPIVILIKEAVNTARLGIREDIEFSADYSNESLIIYCDPVEIQQMMINLINNARDSLLNAPERKIHISVDMRSWDECPRNTSCLVCNTNVVHITVKDSGSGMNSSDIEHIFDPFFTTKEAGKGTGLGLSMAKGTIESHGGTINVNSTIGAGTTFEVCLPLTQKVASNIKHDELQAMQSKANETILIIDDEEIVRTTLSQALLSLGYKVINAKDGQDGLDQFYKHEKQIALIISDVVMPIMNGPVAIKEIHQHQPLLPVIFITGYDGDELNKTGYDGKFVEIISKPFNINRLSHKVYKLLQTE